MAVDTDLLNLATTQFSANLELLLQQKGSKLRSTVREGAHVGKQASPINQIGAIQAKAPAGRFAPKERVPESFTRRWVFPVNYEMDQYIDTFDELQTIVDPKSDYATNATYAIGRAYDDTLIAATTGSAQTGTDGASFSAETFDTTKFRVAKDFNISGTAVGLTVDKLIEARRILRKYHNDLENDALTLIIGSQQEADLLNQVEVVSTEFNDRPVLVDGNIRRFLGYNVIVMERLPSAVTGANLRGCLAYVKSGMYLGVWKDMVNRASIRNDLSSEPWDLFTAATFGATRLQPGKVIQILCSDSTGTDINP